MIIITVSLLYHGHTYLALERIASMFCDWPVHGLTRIVWCEVNFRPHLVFESINLFGLVTSSQGKMYVDSGIDHEEWLWV